MWVPKKNLILVVPVKKLYIFTLVALFIPDLIDIIYILYWLALYFYLHAPYQKRRRKVHNDS